jgi:hypothetical protein
MLTDILEELTAPIIRVLMEAVISVNICTTARCNVQKTAIFILVAVRT